MIGLALFVYIRPEHTRKVMESIKRNGFDKIYIFQDGLRKEEDRENWEKVSALVKSMDLIGAEIHISKKNKGLANSIMEGMDYVFQRHEMAVALEDDVVLADGYKGLMESCFAKYRNNPQVVSICGGGYGTLVPEKYPYDIFFAYRMSSVAFGTWRDRWEGFQRDPLLLKKVMANPKKKAMLELAGNDISAMSYEALKGNIDTWATYWSLYQINRMGYHVIPVKGYARDIGRDGTGTNTTHRIYRYDIELDGRKKEKYLLPDEIFVDKAIIHDTNDLVHIPKPEDKYKSYVDILVKWMTIYRNGGTIQSYFKDFGIKEVYIYGTGKIASFAAGDLNAKVDIKGYLVEMKQEERYLDALVYDMQDDLALEDIPILLIPAYDVRYISHLFRKKGIENQVLLIGEILDYCLKLL